MQTGRINVALVGHGAAGCFIHGPLIEACDGLRIAVVATSRRESLEARRGAPRVETDPLAACQADEVDLVVIATPNPSHFQLASAALQAGKHVVIDKPFVLSIPEADALLTLAHDQQRLLTVFQNRRLDGDFIAVACALRQGLLGNLYLAELRWDRFRPRISDGWRNQAGPGSGLLWDLGPHLLDQAYCLFGPPDSWMADVAKQRPGAESDDYFEVVLRYGAMRCILSASVLVAAPRPRFALHGDKGSFTTHGLEPFEQALRLGRRPGEAGFQRDLPGILGVHVDAEGLRREQDIEMGAWDRFYDDVARAIRTGSDPAVNPVDGREYVKIIETVHALVG